MSVAGDGDLHIYVLAVRQADTAVVVAPGGTIMVIDAVKPNKLRPLLQDLGLPPGGHIEELVITHPHYDHYSAAGSLLADYTVDSVTLAPFWNAHSLVSPSYATLVNTIEAQDIPVRFVAGYQRIYPEGAVAAGAIDPSALYLELLGPPNRLTSDLEDASMLDINHLSIISRLTWGSFSMVFAADAQMENWAAYDAEGMLNTPCRVLKTAHHGSGNGTQWERLNRLSARYVLVSSDPTAQHPLPDLVGAATFAKYEQDGPSNAVVALTSATGTIEIRADTAGHYEATRFGDLAATSTIDLASPITLTRSTNPTDWQELLRDRVDAMYPSP